MTVGASPNRCSLFAFFPDALSVKVGTTVTFKSGSIDRPHNVGIGEVNYQFGLLGQIDLFPNGPPTRPGEPDAVLRQRSARRRAAHVQRDDHGNGFLATNVVWKSATIQGLAKQTKITFTAPSTFQYMCQIHAEHGRDGERPP